jgi:hypothetical protein
MSVSENTKVNAKIGSVIIAVFALLGVGWRAANAIRDVTDEVKALRNDVRAIHNDRWSFSDMERWSFRLERENRERGLVVPDPREIRIERP